jgi:hypothetical protein
VGKELSRRKHQIQLLTRELKRLQWETKDLDQPLESGSDVTSAGSSGANSDDSYAGSESSSDITSERSSDGGSDLESGSDVTSSESSNAESGSESDESLESDKLLKGFRALKKKAEEAYKQA